MNSESNHWTSWVLGHARKVLVFFAASIPIVLFGAHRALNSTSNDPRQWLPNRFAASDTYEWFEESFGTDEIAVMSWPDCTLDDTRVEQLALCLENSPYFDRAHTGPRVLRELTSPPLSVPESNAMDRLTGILIGADKKATCIMLVTSAAGRADRLAAVDEIVRLAASECDLASDSLRLAGPTVDAAAIDKESRRLLFQLAGISALLSFVVATVRMRSFRLAVMVLAGAIYSTALTLAILYFSGGKMNLLMTMLPPLVYVLSISASVHLANYYRDAADHLPVEDAPSMAMVHGWLPCVMAALTTAVGLASLMMSTIEPIRMFGLYAAAGVLISVVVLFLFLPSALRLFPALAKPRAADSPRDRLLANGSSGIFVRLIGRYHVAVTTVCLVLMAYCGWGLLRVKSTIRLQDRFLPDSKVVGDYRWLEERVGPMVPLEVVIRFGHASGGDLLDQIQLVTDIQQAIQSLPEACATMSAADLIPPIPQGGGASRVIRRVALERQLLKSHQSLMETHFLAERGQERLWRISVRANAIGELDYGQFTDTLRRQIEPQLNAVNASATYTGIIPLIYKAQRQLLQDLVRSFFTAFAVIAVVLIFLLRSLRAAMLAMVPNLFPAVAVFGSMGWGGIPVQIGSVMTASAALGIAVDDTIHFLTWFRRGLDDGKPRPAALHGAFDRCASAMAHTTMICASGLLVFVASSFVPILHFAWLMVLLLLAALVGDLVLLPAILAGRLGAYFKPRKTQPDNQDAGRQESDPTSINAKVLPSN